jgi:hypothetical protein
MAAYSSTQSGNFSSAATWGGSGYPNSAGDTFTINNGHTVTYDVTTPVATGFGDSTINNGGRLTFASGARGIRFSGNFNIYGDIIMGVGHTIYGNGATKRINFFNGSGSGGSRREMVGSAPLALTTTTGATTGLSGTIPVTSATGFAVGDWIAVFNREGTDHQTERQDEGFIIHDISGNNIYVREFVGPSSVITGVSGAKLYVEESEVFRVGQALICGTGADRFIATVTAIDNVRNEITTSASASSSIIGETVYTTGPVRNHKLASTVRRCAGVVTVTGTTTDTTVTVNDASNYNVGDEVIVESLGVGTYKDDETPIKRTIVSKSGNNITFDGSFGYTIEIGAYLIKLTRDCRFVNENTTSVYFHENNNSNWNRYLILRDVEFYDSQQGNSTASRVYFRGRNRDDYDDDAVAIEGMVFNNNIQGTYQEIRFYRYLWRWTIRCCAFYNQSYVLEEQGYNNDDMGWFNNWSGRMENSGFRFGYKEGVYSEVAYNRVNGVDDTMFAFYNNRSVGLGFHHNSGAGSRRRAIDITNQHADCFMYQNEFLLFFEPCLTAYANMALMQYNYFDTAAIYDFYSFSTAGDNRRGNSARGTLTSYEHNYKEKDVAIYFSGGRADYVPEESAYKVIFDNDSAAYYGLPNQVWVPADATVRVSADLKLVDGYSGNSPRLEIRPEHNGYNSGANTSYISGHINTEAAVGVNFSNTATGWQTVTATLPPVNIGRFINVAICATSTNSSEGWYQKPLTIYLDKMPPGLALSNINNLTGGSQVSQRASFTEPRIRIGGRFK